LTTEINLRHEWFKIVVRIEEGHIWPSRRHPAESLFESGRVSDQAEIACYEGISRARLTQIMSLLRISPEIQDHILSMTKTKSRPAITEHFLRPITQIDDHREQLEAFNGLEVRGHQFFKFGGNQ
jgi:hypothetical protein